MRILDILASAMALMLLGPLMLAVAMTIKLSSPGPILYRARRVGRYGTVFTMYKFRSMRVDADAGAHVTAGDDDPRITRVGAILRKLKLDELPQLMNVLTGEMGLVGPRPEDPAFLPYYSPEERRVLDVRPGLTGPVQLVYHELAEQHMRPDTDPTEFYVTHVLHQRLAIDLAYARGRTLWGDLRLIGQTVLHIAGIRANMKSVVSQEMTGLSG